MSRKAFDGSSKGSYCPTPFRDKRRGRKNKRKEMRTEKEWEIENLSLPLVI